MAGLSKGQMEPMNRTSARGDPSHSDAAAPRPRAIRIHRLESELPSLSISLAPHLEANENIFHRRMHEVAALAGYLRARLIADCLWPKGWKTVEVTLGAPESTTRQGFFQVSVEFPTYASRWSAKQFAQAVCEAAPVFVRLIEPRAPVDEYVRDFTRDGGILKWFYEVELPAGPVSRLNFSLSSDRFDATLDVTPRGAGTIQFPVWQSGPSELEWLYLFDELRVGKNEVALSAVPHTFVRIPRKGRRPLASSTGSGESLLRFVAKFEGGLPIVVQDFDSPISPSSRK